MKKYLFQIVLCALAFAACNTKQTPNEGANTETLPTDSVVYDQSLKGVNIVLRADLPTKNESMMQTLASFVGEITETDLTGKGTKADDLFQALFDAKFPLLKEMTGGPEDEPDDAFPVTFYDVTLEKVYENDSLVSWHSIVNSTVFNTPHPNINEQGITLRKADGQRASIALEDTDSEEFCQLLKITVRTWMQEEYEMPDLNSDEQQRELMQNPEADINHMPLPEKPLYLVEEGVALPYQSYELLQGSAIIVLPYDAVKISIGK